MQIVELKNIYQAMDVNSDGTISRDELGLMMRNLGEYISEDEIDNMFFKIDQNQDGTINFQEFVHAAQTGMI